MLNPVLIILYIFQVTAFIAAALMWQKYNHTKQRYFLHFMIYVLITEAVAYCFAFIYEISNQSVYNIFTVVSGFFYLFWFYSLLKQKKIILTFLVVFIISIIVAIFKEDFLESLWRIPLTTITVQLLICATLYFSNLLNSIDVISFKKEQQFWIVTGLLIFYLGFLPLQLLQQHIDIKTSNYLFAIVVLNSVMYGFFTIGFICLKKK